MKKLTLTFTEYALTHCDEVKAAIEAGATSESHKDDPSKIVMTFASKAKADAFSKAIGDTSEDDQDVAAPDAHEDDQANDPVDDQ